MRGFTAVLRREWVSAFSSPLAYLFIAGYALITTISMFEWGDFFHRGQADLSGCLTLQPWILLWLAPALSMRSWAEERRHGTLEALLTQPIDLTAAISAKWLTSVALLTLAIIAILPLWVTVSFLGRPDQGATLAGFLGIWLLGASLLAIGSVLSASTRHQFTAFIGTALCTGFLLFAGHAVVADFLRTQVPSALLEAITDLSALTHYRGVVRGVIGLDDLAYFLGLILVGLLATKVILESERSLPISIAGRKVPLLLALSSLALISLVLSATAPRLLGRARWDLTEEHLYTLAPATQKLLESIKEPVTLTLYASSRTLALSPAHAIEARRLRELLSDIAARSRDRIHFNIIDPAPFSNDEDHAADAGLRSLPVGEAGDSLWLGLVAECRSTHAAIDIFEPAQSAFVEYRIARLIRQVARPRKATIGLLSTLPTGPAADGTRRAWAFDDEIREQYSVIDILPEQSILPTGLDALIILHPKGLHPDLVKSIRQYVTQGGHAFMAVDPDAQFDGQSDDAEVGSDHASNLEPLLSALGVRFDPTLVIGDLDNALLVGSGRGGRSVRHLGFSGFGTDSLSAGDPVTSGLHRLNFATPGFLKIHAPQGVIATPLIETSRASAPFKASDLLFGATPESLRHGFHPTGDRYTIAARLQGYLSDDNEGGHTSAIRPADVIIVADTDWLNDTLWLREEQINGNRYREPWANNGDFLLNAVDALSGGSDLMGLRGREPMSRTLTTLEDLRNRADKRLGAQVEALEQSLSEVTLRISHLAGGIPGGTATNSQQRGDLADAEIERMRLLRALRSVHHEIDHEAAQLARWIYAINLVSVPLIVTLIAFVRLRRRYQRSTV